MIRMTRGNKGESRIAFGKHKSVTSPSRVNHSWYRIETAFKCLFLDFGSDSLQFDNGSNYFELGVIKFINIFSYFFYSSYEGFYVTDEFYQYSTDYIYVLEHLKENIFGVICEWKSFH